MVKKNPAAAPRRRPVEATEQRATGHAKLELPRKDYERMRKEARARGLSISAYVRQAVLMSIKEDEEGNT
jgi:hypothetical protein